MGAVTLTSTHCSLIRVASPRMVEDSKNPAPQGWMAAEIKRPPSGRDTVRTWHDIVYQAPGSPSNSW